MAFQNPAQNFAAQRLSLGNLIMLLPHSTFLVRSNSNYPEAGVMQGSVLAIDRAPIPQHRHIIVAEIEGELILHKPRTGAARAKRRFNVRREARSMPSGGVGIPA